MHCYLSFTMGGLAPLCGYSHMSTLGQAAHEPQRERERDQAGRADGAPLGEAHTGGSCPGCSMCRPQQRHYLYLLTRPGCSSAVGSLPEAVSGDDSWVQQD